MLCLEVVKRGGEAVYKYPPGCGRTTYVTRVVELPRVEVVAAGDGWRVERLETGEVYAAYDHVFDALDAAFSAYDRPAALLLYGPPGTGKSYAAKYFSLKWGRKLYVRTMSDILSKWVHETEERLSSALEKAEAENAVVLLDEFEYIASDRMRRDGDRYTPQTVPVLLSKIQEMRRGVVVATTNMPPRYLDAALRRGGRFKPVPYPAPSREMIEALAKALGREAPPGAVNFADILDYRGAQDTRWYSVLPPLPYNISYYRIEPERGVYSYAEDPVAALLAVWLYYAPRRQVWHVYSAEADFSAIVEMAETFGAVVFVDNRVAAEFWKSLVVPPAGFRKALIIINDAVPAPPLRIRFLTPIEDMHELLKRVLQTDDVRRWYYSR